MGARWAWDARCCNCQHSYSGFSGGPDGCPRCLSDNVVETTPNPREERIAELEAEVERLRAELEAASIA